MQKRVKLSVIQGNHIDSVYGFIIDNSPLKIQCEDESIFKKDCVIIFSEIIDNERNIYIISVKDIQGNIISFGKIKRIDEIFFKNHYIELNHSFNIAEINGENETKYKHLVENINKQELSSTASRLKEVFSRDDVENREIITFLMDINSKLDEILYLLKPKEKIEGTKEYQSLILSEDGILFASDKPLSAGKIFIWTTIRDGGGIFSFAAICSVEKFVDAGEYMIYRGLFTDLSFDIKDKIIKYIFRLEREMLKEAGK